MAEWHDTGHTREENYAREKRQINQEFDKKLANKGFFTSRSSIEEERKQALNKNETNYYGERSGGGMTE